MQYILLVWILMFSSLSSAKSIPCEAVPCEVVSYRDIYHPNQTSASLLVGYAKHRMEHALPKDQQVLQKQYLLIYDIYIKARSYAILNKIFFWLSVFFALLVLLWPSISVVFKEKLSGWEWVKSATVQTTVTGIAAVMFAFYSQYKDKQTYAEQLMRDVVYSEGKEIEQLAQQVSKKLAQIDNGFSFSSMLNTPKLLNPSIGKEANSSSPD